MHRPESSRRAGPVALALAVLAALGAAEPGPARAQPSTASPQDIFRIEVDPEVRRRGGPTVSGFIYNPTGNRAGDVRVRAEVLDEAGTVVGEGLGWVYGVLPPGGRGFFMVPIPRPGSSYRVTIVSFNWLAIEAP